MVEAAGQLIHPFRDGLDYAFIPVARDAERVIHRLSSSPRRREVMQVNPSIRPPAAKPVGESMSLYRAGLKLAFFLPLGVAIPPSLAVAGFTDVSSIVTLPLRAEATN